MLEREFRYGSAGTDVELPGPRYSQIPARLADGFLRALPKMVGRSSCLLLLLLLYSVPIIQLNSLPLRLLEQRERESGSLHVLCFSSRTTPTPTQTLYGVPWLTDFIFFQSRYILGTRDFRSLLMYHRRHICLHRRRPKGVRKSDEAEARVGNGVGGGGDSAGGVGVGVGGDACSSRTSGTSTAARKAAAQEAAGDTNWEASAIAPGG